MQTLTVVIPTLNEAERLPALLGLLAEQTRQPDAIVVADAGSSDTTAEIARSHGARVVVGGKPAAGRNAGAAVAVTDLVLFLDADDVPARDFIEMALSEFGERELGVATAHVEPLESDAANVLACDVVNLYLDLMQYVAPHAPGFCILVDRAVHERIGGFDQTVVLAEDHDYVQRAAKVSKFRVLRSVGMCTSMRRIEKEGLVRLAFKYVYCEVFAVTGTPIHRVPFDYEFGAFEPQGRAVPLFGVGEVREALAGTATHVARFSANGLERLRLLGETNVDAEQFESALHSMAPDEVAKLRRYVRARVRLARRVPRHALANVRSLGDTIWQRIGPDGRPQD